MVWPHERLATLLIFVALVAGCQTLFSETAEESATPTPIPTPIIPDKPTYVVQTGEVIKEVEFSGRISAVEEEELFFRAGGFVKRVLFQRGDLVETGDLVAELENDDLLKEMAQAQVALNSAQLRLDEAENNLARQTTQAELDLAAAQARLTQAENANTDGIAQAELALSIAQEQLARLRASRANVDADAVSASIGIEDAERRLAEAQQAYDTAFDPGREWELWLNEPTCRSGEGGSVPCTGPTYSSEMEREREGAVTALTNAENNLTIAQARYNQALAAQQTYQHDLTIQELQVAQAELNRTQLGRGVDPLLAIDVERAQQELARLEEGVDPVLVNEVSQAQLSFERLQAQVADGQIVAPLDGRILSISLRPGRSVEAFAPVVIIADPSAIELSANPSTSQLEEMAEGQEATITLTAYPDQEWRGTIRRLPYPYGTGGGTVSLEDTDTSVRISIDGDVSSFELGDLARVNVVLEEKDQALWLPPEAIRTFQGRNFVVLQDDERQRRVDVQVGIESRDRVEILEGLQDGQLIVGQ